MSKVTEEDITQFYLNVADMLGTPTKETLNNNRKKDLVNMCYDLFKRQDKLRNEVEELKEEINEIEQQGVNKFYETNKKYLDAVADYEHEKYKNSRAIKEIEEMIYDYENSEFQTIPNLSIIKSILKGEE